jgi:GT2 family glycosyltransferase
MQNFVPAETEPEMETGRARDPLVSVIVVNWNGMKFIDCCLSSLEKQTWKNREFILVDNGSEDGSAEYMRRWAEKMAGAQTILLTRNTGYCEANNLAFARARGEWIALLNNDAVAEPNWIEELVRRGDAARGIGMLGGKILFAEPKGVIDKAGHLIYWDGQNRGRGTMEKDAGQFDQEEEILWPDACAAVYHRRVFEETGGFDESFFAFGDDADLGMRARLLGWKAWYVPEAVVHHRHSATAGAYSPLKIMLVERNRLLLAVKNFPLLLLIANPYWSLRRFFWHAYAACKQQGAAGQIITAHGWWQLPFILGRSYLSAALKMPAAVRKRWKIQGTKRLSNREIWDLLRKYQIDLRQLTIRD